MRAIGGLLHAGGDGPGESGGLADDDLGVRAEGNQAQRKCCRRAAGFIDETHWLSPNWGKAPAILRARNAPARQKGTTRAQTRCEQR
jgi:hypothetical protein